MPKLAPNSRSESASGGRRTTKQGGALSNIFDRITQAKNPAGSISPSSGSATPLPSVAILDSRGKLTSKILEVDRLAFRALSWYYALVDLSWRRLLFWACVIYILANCVGAGIYYGICLHCGVEDITVAGAFYFNVVTFASNGGYEGEDRKMLTPGTQCFSYRSFLVVVESFLGASFAAIMTATFVSRASRPSSLRHRIVFSDIATVNTVVEEIITDQKQEEGPKNKTSSRITQEHNNTNSESKQQFEVQFRIANSSKRPLINSSLKVYLSYRKVVDSQRGGVNVVMRTEELSWECREEEHSSDPKSLLLWFPVTIAHRIQKDSPLSYFTPSAANSGTGASAPASAANVQKKLQMMDPQIVATFSTSDGSSGASMQARHCYSVADIICGYHFDTPMTKLSPGSSQRNGGGGGGGNVLVNLGSFNHVSPTPTIPAQGRGGCMEAGAAGGGNARGMKFCEQRVEMEHQDDESNYEGKDFCMVS